MSRYKNLLVPFRVIKAGRKRKCYRKPDEHVIQNGETCIEVKVKRSYQGYCLQCAQGMLQQAKQTLSDHWKRLGLVAE